MAGLDALVPATTSGMQANNPNGGLLFTNLAGDCSSSGH